jgi:hypothetical protein
MRAFLLVRVTWCLLPSISGNGGMIQWAVESHKFGHVQSANHLNQQRTSNIWVASSSILVQMRRLYR